MIFVHRSGRNFQFWTPPCRPFAMDLVAVKSVQCSAMRLSRCRVLLVVFACIGYAGLFAETKPWTLDAIMDLKSVSDPEITADGSKVAYVVRGIDAHRNVYSSEMWVVAASGGPGRRLAAPHDSDAHPRWSPDSRTLAFLSRWHVKTQIYVVSTQDGAPRRLTDSPTDITDFKWSPDGRYIGYLATDANPEREAKRRQGDDAIVGGEGYTPTRLHIFPAGGGVARTLTAGTRHLLTFDWSPDGSKVVYAVQKSPQGRDAFHVDIYESELSSGRETALVVQPGQDMAPAYSGDGRYVAFYSQRGVLSYFGERQVGVVPSGGGAIRYVTDRLDGDVFGGAMKYWWSKDASQLIFGAGKGTSEYLFAVNPTTGDSERLPHVLTSTSAFSVSRDGRRIAWTKSSTEVPGDVYLKDSESGSAIRLSDVNPQVREYRAMNARTVRWRSTDGLEVEGVLRLPFDYSPGTRVPLLVSLHGGPTGAALESFPIPRTYPTQLFLGAGFAVFEPNFRGSINYGPKFRKATIEAQGFGDMDDIMTGIDNLVDQGIADPDRLGVMGWSYGGYLSAWIVAHSNRFKAASIGACGTDWVSWYGPSIANKESAPEVMWEYFGGPPWNRLDVYNSHSARAFLKNIRTPSLVLHGEQDIDSGPEVYVALRDLNVPVSYVTYPREGHGIAEPMHQRDLMRRNLEWFEKWILGK
jgi:dipeptidyl aminopeptidase/acylaminoacyl peptidase